eukprot:TRINITY_DN39853_c0_g1_i1.p1 TRINITY_DN39853_c0_g1~~TRINITY_DN39853_c0_g1_i1.p1  ORF type:complete len:676 (+),score=176.00 TRINITY_DN39853_c0_g1_i1:142-2169(+)
MKVFAIFAVVSLGLFVGGHADDFDDVGTELSPKSPPARRLRSSRNAAIEPDAVPSLLQTGSHNRFKRGDKVIIKGLEQAQALNGQEGQVLKFDHQQHRYTVRMPTGQLVNIKRTNLQLLEDDSSDDDDNDDDQDQGNAQPQAAMMQTAQTETAGGSQTDEALPGQERLDPKEWPSINNGATLQPGDAVTLSGLVSAPELNGQQGTVKYFDAKTGRFTVVLQSAGPHDPPRSLKPTNLYVASADPPAASAPRPAAASKGVSVCQTAQGADSGPAGFPRGSTAVLQGLQSALAIQGGWNGQKVKVHCYDTTEARYVVEMSDGTPKEIKPSNLGAPQDAAPVAPPVMQAAPRLAEAPTQVVQAAFAAPAVSQAQAAPPETPSPAQGWRPGQAAPVASEVETVIEDKAVSTSWKTGDKAELVGLKAAAFNGKVVEIEGIDEKTKRYKVLFSNGALKKVKADNLKATSTLSAPKLTICNTYDDRDEIKVFAVHDQAVTVDAKPIKVLQPNDCFGAESFPKGNAAFLTMAGKELLRVPIDLGEIDNTKGREITLYRRDLATGEAAIHDNTVQLKDDKAYYLHLLNAYAGSDKVQLSVKRGAVEKVLPLDRSYRMDKLQNIVLNLNDGLRKLKMAFKPQKGKTYVAVLTGADADGTTKTHSAGLLLHELGTWTSKEELAEKV